MIETRKSFRNEPDPSKWTFYDRLMSSKMSKAIKVIGDAYEKMLFREVVKEGFYELQVSEGDVTLPVVLLLYCCCIAVYCCCIAAVLLCIAVVLLWCCCCVAVVLLLCSCCIAVVLLLCSCCVAVVLLLYCCCVAVVLLLYCCCVAVVLLCIAVV